MPQERWTAVDEYLAGHYVPPDSVLEAALAVSFLMIAVAVAVLAVTRLFGLRGTGLT